MDDTTFQEIETEFNSVLSGLDTDPALQSFKTEYEKLYQALSKSHDSEKRLMGKCRELNAELVTAASKVRSFTTPSSKDAKLDCSADQVFLSAGAIRTRTLTRIRIITRPRYYRHPHPHRLRPSPRTRSRTIRRWSRTARSSNR